jgi:mono/diheme cytochrome c family protein
LTEHGCGINRLAIAGLIAAALFAAKASTGSAQETEILARGQVHYRRYCGVCHGERGKGDGPVVEDLKVKPADLTQLSKRNGGAFPFWRAYRTIDGREAVQGHGTREMPLWGNEIKIDESAALPRFHEDLVAGRIWQMLSYLQSLQEK